MPFSSIRCYRFNFIGTEPQYKDLNEAIKKFEDELSEIENNIHQTKNKSVQDPLNYGIKLNNRLAHLLSEQGQGDFRPTEQGELVREELTKKIDSELQKLHSTININVDGLNKMMIRDKGIDMVMVKKQAREL